ncbi:glycosyltransferase [Pseudocnuella soli]|uniref:glycosyltransferase n=1 Tax=Pseudocnuella soli TaxID=2502779 RepID=UPI0010476F56|nr:glycosyltransferase [Pseudocnuella soli]
MHRICNSLVQKGYHVTLVGRQRNKSLPLKQQIFQQKRLPCFFSKGFLFYAEYNLRLLFYLAGQKMDAICAIDLDTILPCFLVSQIKRIPRVYDAHELFTEMKEVRTRPFVHRFWLAVERYAVPKFRNGYTVGNGLANEFNKRYAVQYEVIRNVPVLKNFIATETQPLILYQGAVNEARGLEYLIPAMKGIPVQLFICGDGNFMNELQQLIQVHGVADKVVLKGMLPPDELGKITRQAVLGINLIEQDGLNQYLSLANKFFDYIHAGVPQVSMNYPEYKALNNQYEVAYLIDELSTQSVSDAILFGINDAAFQASARQNCLKARQELNWQEEEKKLLHFYQQLLG